MKEMIMNNLKLIEPDRDSARESKFRFFERMQFLKLLWEDENSFKISIESTLRVLGIKRLFLPPGSPQLNPVEIMISEIKSTLIEEKEGI